MTGNEFKVWLATLGPDEKEQFKFKHSHGGSDDDRFVLAFVASPEMQARCCHHLGVPSQADKMAEASIEAARYAKAAFAATVTLGIPALILAVVTLFT